jgi:hypothetical protein
MPAISKPRNRVLEQTSMRMRRGRLELAPLGRVLRRAIFVLKVDNQWMGRLSWKNDKGK